MTVTITFVTKYELYCNKIINYFNLYILQIHNFLTRLKTIWICIGSIYSRIYINQTYHVWIAEYYFPLSYMCYINDNMIVNYVNHN